MRILTTAALCVALAGCQPGDPAESDPAPSQAAPEPARYVCEDGGTIETRSAGGGPLELTRAGETTVLRPADAVSGARWTGESLEWWIRLEDGRELGALRQLGPDGVGDQLLALCERPAPGAGAVAAPPSGEAAGPAPCRTPALTLALVSQDAGAGSRGATFALTNAGSAPCRLEGAPRLALDGGAGVEALEIAAAPGAADPVDLAPGGRAWFDVLSSAMPHGDEPTPCPAVTAVRAGAPGDTGWAEAAYAAEACGGAVRVTPVRASETP